MVLSVVRGEVSLATPALHQSLARRAAVGRPQHGEWHCSDIPTEAQVQVQRHAAERLEQQRRELRREEAEAAAAEAKRDKENQKKYKGIGEIGYSDRVQVKIYRGD